MVKFSTLLMASMAILAVSTNAQVSTEPRSISLADFDRYTISDPVEFDQINEPEASEEESILPYPGPHGNNALERRAIKEAVTKKAAKKPSVKLTNEQQSILDTHNKYRALHKAPPLKWNAKIAAFGNNAIKPCKFQHSGGPHGENLAAGYRSFEAAIDAWYNEVKFYSYNNPGFSMKTGHFTQVVWKGSKSVGCAKRFCANSNWYIYICEYDLPGNYQGEFPKNVLPKAK